MLYYYKTISKQDITKSFVINKRAVDHFFGVNLVKHGDEGLIWIYEEDKVSQQTRIVMHQDVRLLLKIRNFNIGDVAFFSNLGDNKFQLEIISNSNDLIKILSKMNTSNFYLSNTKIEL